MEEGNDDSWRIDDGWLLNHEVLKYAKFSLKM